MQTWVTLSCLCISRADSNVRVLTGAQGVANLVTAAQRQGRVRRVVLVSSIGADDPFFPLNLLWGVRPPRI